MKRNLSDRRAGDPPAFRSPGTLVPVLLAAPVALWWIVDRLRQPVLEAQTRARLRHGGKGG